MDREQEEFGRELGRRIQQAREAMSLTQTELAALVGLSHAQISRLEAGLHLPKAYTLRRLADALEIRLEHLIPPSGETRQRVVLRAFPRPLAASGGTPAASARKRRKAGPYLNGRIAGVAAA